MDYRYLIGGIRVTLDATDEEILKQAEIRMKRAGISTRSLHFRLYKRSVDARKKDRILLDCTVLAEIDTPIPEHICKKNNWRVLKEAEPCPKKGTEPMRARPMVVGMGPAGLFASLLLAENGYAPILIDRGGEIADRVRAVELFGKKGILDTDCNVQFGAGGAGTFSDGKLVTRIHDTYCQYVIKTLHRFGAPDEILTQAKPHVGTDVLREVVQRILNEIERLGGTLLYRCRMEDFGECSDGTLWVKTTKGDFSCGALVLAIGHSARDTYLRLLEKNYAIEAKPISVGVRVEHLQEDIDRALYGDFAGHPRLGHAEYALSDTRQVRGVYTFCMCPGGEVVAAASENGGVVVNGMSNHARAGRNANAAVLTSISCNDYEPVNGNAALGAIAFQRSIERAAFRAGGEDYAAPIMTLGDFLHEKSGTEPTRVLPTYRNGIVRTAHFDEIFPPFVTESLRYAFHSFGKKVEGYDAKEAVLTAAETRTSAPLRILRLPEVFTALGHDLVYPCGEGAGYAGGITSAGVDGARIAEAIIARFAPMEKDVNGGVL